MLRWFLPLVVACAAGALLIAANHRSVHVTIHPGSPQKPDPTSPLVHDPCDHPGKAPKVYDHVIWVWMGSRGYDDVMAKPALANYSKAYAAACGVATAYTSVTHAIVPNQVAALAGQTFGLDSNTQPVGGLQVTSLFNRVPSWRVYMGGMRTACQRTDSPSTHYRARNNPGLLFAGIPCAQNDVPIGDLSGDLKNNTLPRFGIVVPGACQSMTFDSSCPGPHRIPAFVAEGDFWLGHVLTQITGSPAYRAGRTAVFVTWTEGTPTGPHGLDCLRYRSSSCHVATIAIAPTVDAGTQISARFSHYALLKTTERLLGVRRLLGHSLSAPNMRAAFGL